jgi:predicted transcriptional regulator
MKGSGTAMTTVNRSRIEIISSILSLCREKPSTVGELQFLAKLNGQQTSVYLNLLVKAKLLKLKKYKSKKIYTITLKGKNFLALYGQIKDLLP